MAKRRITILRLALPPRVHRGVQQAGGFDRVLSSIPASGSLSRSAKRYTALSDEIRLKILWALSESDLCPCLLKRVADVTDSKLSYHLGMLVRAGLIRSSRTKSWRIYTITASGRAAIKAQSKQ